MSEGRKFEARYPGRCPACGERIDVGDDLVMEDEQAVHFECAGRTGLPDPRGRAREVCPSCFTQKAVNGACACEEPT